MKGQQSDIKMLLKKESEVDKNCIFEEIWTQWVADKVNTTLALSNDFDTG